MTRPELYRKSISNPVTRWFTQRRTQQIFDLMSGFVHSQVLLACVKLNIFPLVKQSPATLEELSAHCRVPAPVLQRLLLSAVALRLLEHRGNHRFGLGALGAPLAAHEGIRAMVEHNNLLYQDMSEPLDFLRDAWHGDMAAYWTYAHSVSPAKDSKRDSAQVGRYSALMAASQNFVIEEILGAFSFQKHRCMMDVGCGMGRFVAAVAQREKHLTFKLFDLPAVLELTQKSHSAQGVDGRMQYCPGSFFDDPIPQGADLITLVRVAHDHSDAAVMKILKNIHRALPAGGALLLAEPMAQEPGDKPLADAYFHLYLLAMGSGRFRTPSELSAMLKDCGFASVERVPNAMPIHTRLLLARKSTGA
ncbi:methyltransferase domain-containing protein [Rhodoferax sp. 4810]|nr:methyltransferase domain-containing protein [Rhodoferax jenense]